jgi:predicted ester cyclase
MSEEHVAYVHRYFDEVYHKGNLDYIDQGIVPEAVDHTARDGDRSLRETARESATTIRAAFPDVQITVEDVIVEGNKWVVRATLRGTHRGEFEGIAPTNKQIMARNIIIIRRENDKTGENWSNFDELGLLQQLGVTLALNP